MDRRRAPAAGLRVPPRARRRRSWPRDPARNISPALPLSRARHPACRARRTGRRSKRRNAAPRRRRRTAVRTSRRAQTERLRAIWAGFASSNAVDASPFAPLVRDLGGNRRMRIVALDRDVGVAKGEEILDRGIELQRWQRARLAREL